MVNGRSEPNMTSKFRWKPLSWMLKRQSTHETGSQSYWSLFVFSISIKEYCHSSWVRCKSIPSHPSSFSQLSEYNSNYFIKAFCSLTSVCIFSILFSIHSLLCWQGEFVYQSRASLVKRNAMLVTLSSQRVNIYVVLTDDIDKWKITNNQCEMHTSNKNMAQFSLEWKG